MVLRTFTAILWLLAVSTGGNVLSIYFGLPVGAGLVAGLVVAALVWWDPADKLWRPAADAAIRRRRVADLKRMREASPVAQAHREAESVEA
jgi:hypothetical protein